MTWLCYIENYNEACYNEVERYPLTPTFTVKLAYTETNSFS